MALTTLRRVAAVYTLAGGGLTVALLYPLTTLAGVSYPGTLVGVGLCSLMVGPLLVATSDVGLDTASAGGMTGFQGITDPSAYQPDSLSVPGRVELAAYLVGVGCWSVVVVFLLV